MINTSAEREQLVLLVQSKIGVSRFVRPNELDEITEGRYKYVAPDGTHYSWCGDLPTWGLEGVGVRDPTALNRVSVAGEWTPGDNISRLWRWAKNHDSWRTDADGLRAGDLYIKPVPRGDHIGIITDVTATGYDVVDGNGKMGAVSTGHRDFTDAVHGFIDVTQLLTAKVGPEIELPNPFWPPGNFPIPPIPANWGLPINFNDTPFTDTPTWSDVTGICPIRK